MNLHVCTVLLAVCVTNTLSLATLQFITKVIGTYTVLHNITITVEGVFTGYPDGFPTATNVLEQDT